MAIFGRTSVEPLKEAITSLAGDVQRFEGEFERLRESALAPPGLGLDALKAEDKGWRLMSGVDTTTEELELRDIKEHANAARTLKAANTLVKRGLVVRNAYIWEDEIDYPAGAQQIIDDPINQQSMFSKEAREALENALSTDGQYFLLLDRRKRQARRMPFSEITGVVANPEHKDDIWYYKRSYSINYMDRDGNPKSEARDEYIPSVTFTGNPKTRIGKIKVNKDKRVEHVAVNRQTGWLFGLPDLLGAVYWARAYKEYLEATFALSKALARIAFKVTSQSGKGQRAVQAVAARPTTSADAGGTATMGMGQDLVALNKSGSNVDFSGGTPLASMVAAALDMPLSVVLTDGSAGGRQGAENALEAPTIKTMNSRRSVHLESRKRVLEYFGVTGRVTWTELDAEPIHRRMQAVMQGQETGTLHGEEVRDLVMHILRVNSTKPATDLPEEYELRKQAPNNSPGPLSDGTNDSRDNPGGPTDA